MATKEQYWLITYKDIGCPVPNVTFQEAIAERIIDFLMQNLNYHVIHKLQITKDDYKKWNTTT